MVKDRFGQDIGPGDIVVDIGGQGYLRVVTRLLSDRDPDVWGKRFVTVDWLTGDLRMYATVDPDELFRITDYSEFDQKSQDEVRKLEDLYMTITGERYG